MSKSARIDRMVAPGHLCPWGLKAHDLLRRRGYDIEDNHIPSMAANRKYKEEHDVDETPQIWIEGEHVGGYDALRKHLNAEVASSRETSHGPIVAIFSVAFATAVSTTWAMAGSWDELVEWGFGRVILRITELFIAFGMILLGVQKLRDLESFSAGFLGYDLVAQRWVPYAYLYPFVEAGAGILMIAGVLTWLAAPLALIAAMIGAISVFKAVCLEQRELRCACVGGDSNVPLGAISLTENLMMMAMAVWMMIKDFVLGW